MHSKKNLSMKNLIEKGAQSLCLALLLAGTNAGAFAQDVPVQGVTTQSTPAEQLSLQAQAVAQTGALSLDAPVASSAAAPADEPVKPLGELPLHSSVERHLPGDQDFALRARDPDMVKHDAGDRMEKRQIASQVMETVKLTDVIAPLHFDSGVINIRQSDIDKVRAAMDKVRDKANVRLHIVGHADDQRLSPALAIRYGDNAGLSKERAAEVAETLKRALNLPPEAIDFEGKGDAEPVASNATEEGRAKNRRVEVEVWYDQPKAATAEQDVLVKQDFKQLKICRVQELCVMHFKEGQEKRTRVNNLVPALHFNEDDVQVTPEFVEQVRKGFANLSGKQNVVAKFIGHVDAAPLSDRNARIYGDALALSKARAYRVALAVQQALDLPAAAVQSDGRGASVPLAPNDTPEGRASNRRVEVQFWHDDQLQELSDEPQMCPEDSGSEKVARVHPPATGTIPNLAMRDGNAVIPDGLADQLRVAMDEVKDKDHVRLRFVGYTGNQRIDRRTASVYGDDIGLSASRAHRAMLDVQKRMQLGGEQVESEGRGFVQSSDVANAGFTQGEDSYVVVQVVYDEPAVLDDYDGVQITRLTQELSPRNAFGLNPMHISVDGKPLDDPGRSSADVQRCTDVALDKANIRFQFDGLKASPRLSVSASPQVAAPGEPVGFRMYSNYAAYIDRAEVRVYEKEQSTQATPLAVVPLDANGAGEWQPPQRDDLPAAGHELQYVLRAYDAKGNFDDTTPRPLWLVKAKDDGTASDVANTDAATDNASSASASSASTGAPALTSAYGQSQIALHNIRIGQNTIAVRGSGIPQGHAVWVAGRAVPVDAKGDFVAEEILPDGLDTVEVAVLDEQGNGNLYLRDTELRQKDRFFVGMADVTVSHNSNSGPEELLQGTDTTSDPNSSLDGHLAFYGTQKYANGWRLTASADTREGPMHEIFSNFMDKAPDSLFRRIDPDYYYPTFGDDGVVEEMAPTLGKFYVRAQHGDDYLMWGNFKADYANNEMSQVDRGLYGFDAEWKQDRTTKFGERRAQAGAFAAQPGTIAGRDEIRGTGGSLFYLHNQDILAGSERVRIEMRDKDSHLVTGTVDLQSGLDYDIDYLQGRVLLSAPLSSTGSGNMLVRSSGISGDEAWLVVRYEYTPGFDDIDTLSTGAQAHAWINDYIGFGVTGNDNSGDDTESSGVIGADLTVRKNSDTWLKLQGGRSKGMDSSSTYSSDGGYSYSSYDTEAFENQTAGGYRADLSVAMGDVYKDGKGKLTLYRQAQDAGYSAPGLESLTDTSYYGGTLNLPIGSKLSVDAKGDHREQQAGVSVDASELDVKYQLSERWSVATGVRNDKRDDQSATVATTQEQGARTDAQVRADYNAAGDWSAWGFAQQTVAKDDTRDSNGRVGVGGAMRVTDKLRVDAEVSAGDLGPGGRVGTNYLVSDKTSMYLNYALENETGSVLDGTSIEGRNGNLVSGMKHRLSDSSSVYAEEHYQDANDASGLTHAAGLSLNLAEHWNFGANAEVGTLVDSDTDAQTKRRAGGVRIGYTNGPAQLSSGVEYRKDDSEQTDGSAATQLTTWLFRNNFKYQVSPDWRVLGKYDHSLTNSSQGAYYGGDYTQAVLGFGYRPVLSNRWNTLAKYTYFYNVPTTDQTTLSGTSAQYVQKSHIASVDVSYAMTPYFNVGGKYAYRLGEVSTDAQDLEFFSNRAELFILREELRLFDNKWEFLLEDRYLKLPDVKETRGGVLFGVYRYFGEHVKAGVGYNFTNFSDDLTDLSYRHRGVFLNVVGAM